MNITLKNAFASVTCQTLGAELLSYQTASGKEYLWQKDPAYWAKTSPVLFPYIGAVPAPVLIHGKPYEMPRHGFVKDEEFTIAEQGEDFVKLITKNTDATMTVFPYAFTFSVTFRLEGAKLHVIYGVTNESDQEMPFLIGGHPAFFCPMEEGEHFTEYLLHFEDEDVEDLHLKYPMFDHDAILYENLTHRTVKLIHQCTNKGIQFDFPGYATVAFWTPIQKMLHFSASNLGAAGRWIKYPTPICFRKNTYSICPQKKAENIPSPLYPVNR